MRSTVFGRFTAADDLSQLTEDLKAQGVDEAEISVFAQQSGLLALATALSDHRGPGEVLIAVNTRDDAQFQKALQVLELSGAENVAFVK
jgi:hypothetical protein